MRPVRHAPGEAADADPVVRWRSRRLRSSVCSTMMPALDASTPRLGRMDAESQRWIDRLSVPGPGRDAAIATLHALLLKAARFEIDRRRTAFPQLRGDEDDLAHQSADDALLAVLHKLDSFRGDSRFTTWADKFALFEAAVKLRRRGWQGREVQLEPDTWALIPHGDAPPQHGLETSELLACVGEAIERDLSPHQREVLVAVVLGASRSTSSPNGSTPPAGRSTRPSTTLGASSGPASPIAGSP